MKRDSPGEPLRWAGLGSRARRRRRAGLRDARATPGHAVRPRGVLLAERTPLDPPAHHGVEGAAALGSGRRAEWRPAAPGGTEEGKRSTRSHQMRRPGLRLTHSLEPYLGDRTAWPITGKETGKWANRRISRNPPVCFVSSLTMATPLPVSGVRIQSLAFMLSRGVASNSFCGWAAAQCSRGRPAAPV